VVVRPVIRAPRSRTLELPGTIHGFVETQIHAKISGYLKAIYVDKGDRVKRGQLLALLDSPELDHQTANARANYNFTEITDKRNQSLLGLAVLAPAFVALARLQISAQGFARGPLMVLWLILMVCAADIGAYFAGRAFGRRKLAPRVSPGKTLEGALGGIALVSLIAWAGAVHFGLPQPAVVAFGCAVGIFSIVGDLTESMFKRAAGLKDSGILLPGHGGLLDRIDSVTAAAPLYALGLFGTGVIA